MNRLARQNGDAAFQPGWGAFGRHLTTTPSLTWFSSDLTFLYGLCATAMAGSLVLAFGLVPGPLCLMLWFFYLSITLAGQRFYYFQWDNLLLETGLLAACVLPWRHWRPSRRHLGRLPVFFFAFLLFKIILSSAMAKWNSGDASWHSFTALTYHYETQPLPTPLAFIFHQAPLWFHKVCCFLTFVVQMGAPFLLFLPRRLRHTGALVIMAHQILIALTGNYNFFNLLTISLCLSQLDDDFFSHLLRRPSMVLNPPLPKNKLRYLGLAIAFVITLASAGRMCEVVTPIIALRFYHFGRIKYAI